MEKQEKIIRMSQAGEENNNCMKKTLLIKFY